MNASNLNQMHADPDNWHLVFFYICPADPRIVVKKRIGAMGWTLNFARPLAIPFLVILVAASYGVMRISDMLALGDTGYWIAVVLLILGIVSLCGWLSNPDRHTKQRGEQAAPPNGDKPSN